MRKVVAGAFVTLDGVMQAPGGPEEDKDSGFEFGGWVWPYWDQATDQAVSDLFAAPYDLLLGRRTYDIFAAYWPKMDGDIAAQFNAVTKYVATRAGANLTWNNSVALHGDAAAELAKLKQSDGPRLLIQGSANLIQSLLARDLIDEFRLQIFPLVFGKGKRLFENGAPPRGLKLTRSHVGPTGVILVSYERDGAVKTGAPPNPGG